MSAYGFLETTTVDTTLSIPVNLTGETSGTITNSGATLTNSFAGASANGQFDIVVHYSGDPKYQGAFTSAATRWAQIIVADIPDFNSTSYGFIDDLLIDASIVSIDGPGGTLGQAGPDEFRNSIRPTWRECSRTARGRTSSCTRWDTFSESVRCGARSA